jgi:hypothetical protein
MSFTGNAGATVAFRKALHLSLHDFRETDANGAVGAQATPAGGILASDTTPIMRNTSGKISQEISWAASNADPIVCQKTLPEEFNNAENVVIEAWVNSGTTDPASFTVATSWDAGTSVSTTLTDGAKSATFHKITATIPASSLPTSPSMVTVMLTPAAHTTNAIQLQNIRLLFIPKVA